MCFVSRNDLHVPQAPFLFSFSLFTLNLIFRLWRSWITQQIPILKNGGSNPFRRANENDKFRQKLVVFSYIRLTASYIASQLYLNFVQVIFASRVLEANIISLKPQVSISLLCNKNITVSKAQYN